MDRKPMCGWCATGKPLHVKHFKNPNCYTCESKPDEIAGEKLLSTKEINALRKKPKMAPAVFTARVVTYNKTVNERNRKNVFHRRSGG